MPYLDQRMYFNNMELIGHLPGAGRSGGMQMMSAPGGQRLIFQGGDVIDVTDPRNPLHRPVVAKTNEPTKPVATEVKSDKPAGRKVVDTTATMKAIGGGAAATN